MKQILETEQSFTKFPSLFTGGFSSSIDHTHGTKIWHRPLNTEFWDYLLLKTAKISYSQSVKYTFYETTCGVAKD